MRKSNDLPMATTHTLFNTHEVAGITNRGVRAVQLAVKQGRLHAVTLRGDLYFHPLDVRDFLKAELNAKEDAERLGEVESETVTA